MIQIRVNGSDRDFTGGTIMDLLDELSVKPKGVVVERNGSIIHREEYRSEAVSAGDSIEIVRMVGGG